MACCVSEGEAYCVSEGVAYWLVQWSVIMVHLMLCCTVSKFVMEQCLRGNLKELSSSNRTLKMASKVCMYVCTVCMYVSSFI